MIVSLARNKRHNQTRWEIKLGGGWRGWGGGEINISWKRAAVVFTTAPAARFHSLVCGSGGVKGASWLSVCLFSYKRLDLFLDTSQLNQHTLYKLNKPFSLVPPPPRVPLVKKQEQTIHSTSSRTCRNHRLLREVILPTRPAPIIDKKSCTGLWIYFGVGGTFNSMKQQQLWMRCRRPHILSSRELLSKLHETTTVEALQKTTYSFISSATLQVKPPPPPPPPR